MAEDSYSAVSLQEGYILHDRYRIISVLGRGGFSYTYKAQDSKLDRIVAVKEYFPASVAFRTGLTVKAVDTKSQDSYSAGLQSFVDEAKILARFRQENICSVWDYFEENGTAYLIMSYIDGESLDAVLRKCPNGVMNSGAVRKWLMPLLGALRELHAASYIHRDIKPSNIYITYDGKPVLIDFGAARVSVGRTHGYTVILTPEYAPPEQSTTDISAQGPWTDIYAIAAVAYRCLMGTTPPDAHKRILARANGKTDPLEENMPVLKRTADAGLYEFINKALVLPYEKRLQSVNDVEKILVCPQETAGANEKHLPDSSVQDSHVHNASVKKGNKGRGKKLFVIICCLLLFFIIKSCGQSSEDETGSAAQSKTVENEKYELVLKNYDEGVKLVDSQDYEEAIVYLKKVLTCKSDDDRVLGIQAECAVFLGVLYYYGPGDVPENPNAAFKLLSFSLERVKYLPKSLQKHNYEILGHCYRFGKGTSSDINKAIKLYAISANLGSADAAKALGEVYEAHKGNYREALKWYERALDLGCKDESVKQAIKRIRAK